jgi:DNA-binding MarR family transcriptional regulator
MASIKQSDYETLASFRHSLRRFLSFSEAAAHSIGITPQQHQALLSVRGSPKGERVTIRLLAEHLQIRHHSAVELVNRLEAANLAARAHSEQDQRLVYIELTEHGTKLLENLSTVHKEELRNLVPQLKELLRLFSDDR